MLEDFLESEEKKPSEVEITLPVCKDMIPMIGMKIPEWKGFKKTHLHIQKFKAHKQLYDSLRNKHNSLINQQLKREKEEKDFYDMQMQV